MKIETRLTARDKKLLAMLAVVGILALFWFAGVKPLRERTAELEAEQELLQLEKDSIEMAISQIPVQEKGLSEAESRVAEAEKYFLNRMSNEEIDAMLTSMCIKHGLDVARLSIADAKPGAISWYEKYEAPVEEESEGATESAGKKASAPENIKETSYIYMSEITNFIVSGDETEIRGLIDELTETAGIRVRTYTLSSGIHSMTDTKAVTYQPVQQAILTLVLYMI